MKILLIDAHPDPQSLCAQLARNYAEGARESGHELQMVELRKLEFQPNLANGYRVPTPLEPDLIRQQELITWCEHLVIVTPLWWMSVPALLKGYFDRVLLPRFAFRYHDHDPLWDRLLAGRTARVVYTQDAPQWFQFLMRGDCFWRMMKRGILGFCGFKPVKRTVFSQVVKSTGAQRQSWLKEVQRLGARGE